MIAFKGGIVEFWIFYSSQAYSTKLAHYYWFIVSWNLWNFQGNLSIISWVIQVLGKKNIKVKKFPAHYFFLGLG